MSSDGSVITVPSALTSPSSISPEPAYIAASAASSIITSEHRTRNYALVNDGKFYTYEETATISPASLRLLNSFLDQILYNVLASSRSTSVASLRSAVNDVLKPRLAREAIVGADEELQELLCGGDEEELSVFHNGHDPTGPWDLSSVWRRTRLRCMVYTRLGDLEEDDEEMYIGRDFGEGVLDRRRLVSRDLGIVSPAAAIFLTSIIEFVGEHALTVAGEAASIRLQARFARGDTVNKLDIREAMNLIVEETDMEKLALNPTLGRLWRSWKKQLRMPSSSDSNRSSRDSGLRRTALSTNSQSSSRNNSSGNVNTSVASDTYREGSATEVVDPTSIPLPVSDSDIAEIEVPGYLSGVSSRLRISSGSLKQGRPYSMASVILPLHFKDMAAVIPQPLDLKYDDHRPVSALGRHRSASLPPPPATRYARSNKATSTNLSVPTDSQESVRHSDSGRSSAVQIPPEQLNVTPFDARVGSAGNTVAIADIALGTPASAINNDTIPRMTVQDTEIPEVSMPTRMPLIRPTSDIDLPIQGAKIQDGFTGPLSRVNSSNYNSDFEERFSSLRPSEIPRIYTAIKNTNGEPPMGEKSGNEKPSVPISKYSPQATRDGKGHEVTESMQGGRPDQYAKIGNARSRFVLDAPPAPRSNRSSSTSNTTLSGKDLQPDGSLISHGELGANVAGAETGIPTLTPLRELMDAARDTSDEASSTSPSRDDPELETVILPKDTNGTQAVQFGSSQSSKALDGRRSSVGTKPSELRKPQPAVKAGAERTTLQQILPSAVPASEQGTSRSRRSASINRDGKAVKVSGSSNILGSQKSKGPTPWSQSENQRSSTDDSRSMSSKKSIDTQRPNDKQQSFEQLIKSDETLQYTLTPQSMREMEVRNLNALPLCIE